MILADGIGLIYRFLKLQRNKADNLKKETTQLFCYQSQTDIDLREEHLYITLLSMYQSCTFISHGRLHVTLQLQLIYFTLGALRGSFQGPIKLCAAKQMWNVIFTGTVAVLSHLICSSASISLCSISTKGKAWSIGDIGGCLRHNMSWGRREIESRGQI